MPNRSVPSFVTVCWRRGLRERRPFRRLTGAAVLLLAAACGTVPFDAPRTPSHAIEPAGDTELARAFARPSGEASGLTSGARSGTTSGASGLSLLVSGKEAFAVRAALTESAQRSLDLQYYIVAQDETSTLLLHRTLLAAERGVRVRLLIDDINTGLRDPDLAVLDRHPNVEVRVYNPFATRDRSVVARVLEILGDGERLNRRMHNKLWIADNTVAVMGGRNLADNYFDASPGNSFGDLDVLVAGPVVPQMSRSFDLYWNSAWSVPIQNLAEIPATADEAATALSHMAARAEKFRLGDYALALRESNFGPRVRAGQVDMQAVDATLLFDLPGNPPADEPETRGGIFPALRQIVDGAQGEVIVVSPYLVPGDRGVDVMCGLTRRGVRIKVLTNSLASTDVPLVHAGYARFRARMLACGVQLFELRPPAGRTLRIRPGLSSGASLHAKAVVVDRREVLLGSMNLDPRSRRLNTEVALQFENAGIGGQLGALFDEATTLDQVFRLELEEAGNPHSALVWETVEEGRPVRYVREPLASLWRRISTPLLGVLTPEDLL